MGDDASEDQDLAIMEDEEQRAASVALDKVIYEQRSVDEELLFLGKAMASSGFFADSQRASQAIVKILAGRELGIGPLASMAGVFIIKGRVSLGANLIAAVVKRSGKYDYKVIEHDGEHCTIQFTENGVVVGESAFHMDDAKAAGLLETNPNWRKYARNMLFARAMTNGARWYCPDVFGGAVYSPEEMGRDDYERYDE